MESKCVTDRFGDKKWFNDLNQLHKEDGPALITSTAKYYFFCGELHRTDGPAVISITGRQDYFIDGIDFNSKEEWFAALTPEQQENYIWKL